MIGKVICVSGYSYKDRVTGVEKSGMNMIVQSLEVIEDNDSNGNFKFGMPVEDVKIPKPYILSEKELIELVGSDVEIIKEKRIGDRYERLVAINKI